MPKKNPVIKAWKMVDAEFANGVSWGKLKIGTLASFAEIENGRADKLDGGVSIDLSHYPASSDREHDRGMLRRIGLEMSPSSEVFFENCEGVELPPPCWAFCTSRVGCTHDPQAAKPPSERKPTVTFEISDLAALAQMIGEQHSDLISEWRGNYVKYERIILNPCDMQSRGANPFVKDERFKAEEEFRLVFRPRNTHIPPKTIFTPVNLAIGKLFTRIS